LIQINSLFVSGRRCCWLLVELVGYRLRIGNHLRLGYAFLLLLEFSKSRGLRFLLGQSGFPEYIFLGWSGAGSTLLGPILLGK
jgi:hypothetical protein